MPIWRMGKLREALTINSELYKKQTMRYLTSRGYYLKASSDVEATFADCVLTKRGDTRDYWLEVKATTVSLGEADFLSQLGKYLAAYVSRTPRNRFKMMLVCYKLVNADLFSQIFDRLDAITIDALTKRVIESTDAELEPTILRARPVDIRQFFEDAIIIEADFRDLQVAEEKVAPKPPVRPQLSEAEYAAQILNSFGDVEPIRGSDQIWPNLFQLELPKSIYEARTRYPTATSIFEEKPNTIFPNFQLQDGKIYSFSNLSEDPLSKFIDTDSVTVIDLEAFVRDPSNVRSVTTLVNRWIKQRCKKMGLLFDPRTKTHFFPRNADSENPVVIKWKPRSKMSERELTKSIVRGRRIRHWVHRAASISAKRLWGQFYIIIRSRFLFSPDGINLFDGEKIDTLDRAYRKSKYSRNMNQLYDVLFWYKCVFPEADTGGNLTIDNYLEKEVNQTMRVKEQAKVIGETKPNIEIVEDVEGFEKIEEAAEEPTLDDFTSGEDS